MPSHRTMHLQHSRACRSERFSCWPEIVLHVSTLAAVSLRVLLADGPALSFPSSGASTHPHPAA